MKTWRIKSGFDRRIRARHPWVFSNELSESPKGHIPGAPVRLEDNKGQFLALGYGNPHSLISFRALSFDSQIEDATDFSFLVAKAAAAWKVRFEQGYRYSFRWIYGEGDFFPGLVVDRYFIENGNHPSQVFAVQVLTAGIEHFFDTSLTNDKILKFFEEIVRTLRFDKLSEIGWEDTAVVLRNDVNVRKLEGLQYQNATVIKDYRFGTGHKTESGASHLADVKISLHAATRWDDSLQMNVNLFDGQKTGFFLDQAANIENLAQLVKSGAPTWRTKRKVRILDLCTYVGQWSSKLSQVFAELEIPCEVTQVDVSEEALKFASKNALRAGASKVESMKMDVLEDLPKLADRAYDIVIADPPAFIKAKKDLPTGTHAYLKLNTQAARLTASGGLLVSCSCSGHFKEEDLIQVLEKAIRRDGRLGRCIGKGGHAADHPILMSFSEGFYLKALINRIDDI